MVHTGVNFGVSLFGLTSQNQSHSIRANTGNDSLSDGLIKPFNNIIEYKLGGGVNLSFESSTSVVNYSNTIGTHLAFAPVGVRANLKTRLTAPPSDCHNDLIVAFRCSLSTYLEHELMVSGYVLCNVHSRFMECATHIQKLFH